MKQFAAGSCWGCQKRAIFSGSLHQRSGQQKGYLKFQVAFD